MRTLPPNSKAASDTQPGGFALSSPYDLGLGRTLSGVSNVNGRCALSRVSRAQNDECAYGPKRLIAGRSPLRLATFSLPTHREVVAAAFRISALVPPIK